MTKQIGRRDTLKILMIGDIVGDIGIKKVKEVLPEIKKNHNIDFIIANGENSSDRNGYKY